MFITRNRRQDKQSGSDKEFKDDAQEAREKLATQLESERRETAKGVETERKETAGNVAAEQRRLVERVNTLEQKLIGDIGGLTTSIAVLTERISSSAWMRMQAEMSKSLHHPEPEFAEADELLVELDTGKISDQRRTRLKHLMAERSRDMRPKISDLERATAAVIHIAMDQVEKGN